uniref:Ran gtpase-activating protein n=1 Tax=Ixodes ricinus TaxID=34613 RepID=V5IJV1_IXORI
MTVAGVEPEAGSSPAADGNCEASQPESYIRTRVAELRKRFRTHNLDLDECSSNAAAECWLVRNLTPFNRLIHRVSIEVVEMEPGKLGVFSFDSKLNNSLEEDALYDAAYIFTWLTKHQCVETIHLANKVLLQQPSYLLSMGLSPNIRHLRLGMESLRIVNEEELCEGLGFLVRLESFELIGLDIGHKLASAFADLLKRNAGHLKKVSFSHNYNVSQRSVNAILRGLLHCTRLTELTFDNNVKPRAMKIVARLVRSSSMLHTLSLKNLFHNDESMAILARAFEGKNSVRELKLCSCEVSLAPFFRALEVNETLRDLDLTGCNFIGRATDVLSAALARNTGLHSLVLKKCQLEDEDMEKLAEALEVNRTLRTLNLSHNLQGIRGSSVLCKVLGKNKTLKNLVLSTYDIEDHERPTLTSQLARSQCYGQVSIDWAEADLPNLALALTLPSTTPTVLRLHIFALPTVHVCAMFEAIATNNQIAELQIECFTHRDPVKMDAFYRAIVGNESIRRLHLILGDSGYSLLVTASKALLLNTTVRELEIECEDMSLRGTKHLAHMLARNRTLTKVVLANVTIRTKFQRMLSRGLAKNEFVTEFKMGWDPPINRASLRVHEAIARNVGLVNSAVRFVLRTNLSKRCAEAFEKLRWCSSLATQLAKVTGKADREVKAALDSAAEYIRSNYLVITGVVRERVECLSGEDTQVDRLNHECWRAIATFLKVSDVVG